MNLPCLNLRSPIILGSCDLFVTESAVRRFYTPSIGAVVLKTATKAPTLGYPLPHVARFGDGVLVASGMANPGIVSMCELARKLQDLVVIGSVVDPSLAGIYEQAGVSAIELNLSCPHNPGGSVPAHTASLVYSSVALAKDVTSLPVFAKLTGWSCNVVETARAAQDAGASAVVVSNLFPGTGYYTGLVCQDNNYAIGDCLLGFGHGGYTSRNFLAGVLYMIKLIKSELTIPIIATGGCCADVDALAQADLVGASAVETVTPLYLGKNLDLLYNEYLLWKKRI